MCVYVCVCQGMCVRVCVRACVRSCVCVCERDIDARNSVVVGGEGGGRGRVVIVVGTYF